MRKIILPLMIVVVILLQALPALAYSNSIQFYTYNNCSSWRTKVVMEVKGIENTDLSYAEKISPGSIGNTSDEATAWFLTSTTYRWKITLYSFDVAKKEDVTKLAEFTVKCVTYFLLSPTITEFVIEDKTIYKGDITFEKYNGSASGTFRVDVNDAGQD